MSKKIVYRSTLIPGNPRFDSWKEADEAEKSYLERQRSGKAYESLGQAREMMTTPEQEPVLPQYEKPQFKFGGVGMTSQADQPQEPVVTDPVPYKAPPSPREAMVKSGAAEYMDVPAVEKFSDEYVRTFNEEESADSGDKGVLSTYYNQRLDEAKRYFSSKFPNKTPEEVSNMAFEAVQAPSFSVQTTPEGLEKSKQLSESRKLGKLTPDVIEAEANLAATKSSASTTARETAVRKIQQKYPMLNESQRDVLSDSYIGTNAVNTLINAIENENIGYFDIVKKTGQFTNPEIEQAYSWLTEIIGRDRSGAAINNDEWRSFKNQTLNPDKLLTKEGKKAALNTLKYKLKTPMYAKGASVIGNENWYKDFEGMGNRAQMKAESKPENDNFDSWFESVNK